MPKYPGLGLDLRYHDQINAAGKTDLYPMGIHHNCFGSTSEMLFIREVAMMTIMDRLSDKADFHIKVFDDAITNKWIEEALAQSVAQFLGDSGWDTQLMLKSVLDKACLNYCIKELRAKAQYFEKTGLIPTLDASASAVKSDTIVDESLHNALRIAFYRLEEDQKDNPDWHPRTSEMVQSLVHPSMYPLVYGRTRVFAEEVVGVEDAIDKWAGKGDVIPQLELEPTDKGFRPETGLAPVGGWHNVGVGGLGVHPSFWSPKYQWLPSNLKFQEDGTVKFTSYINNLHPIRYSDIYSTIEKLVEKSLPAWDLCLARYRDYELQGGGRTKPRFPHPSAPDDEEEANWSPPFAEVETPPREEGADSDEDYEEEDEFGRYFSGSRKDVHWYKTREPVQPEAPKFEAWDYGVKPGASLREMFDGLQIIVKMASIELGPGKPEFPPGGWHVEGQMNEHIVGTALYYLDSDNVTPSHLQFRMQTSVDQEDFEVGQNSFNWMEQVYGAELGAGGGDSCLQSYGSVETKEGRLLAFPNVFHHRVSHFGLEDETKTGHRRFIALWLVDPLTRIISTANVPPQQQSWWMERAFGNLGMDEAAKVPQAVAQLILEKAPGHSALEAAGKGLQDLPAELMDIVRSEFGDAVPMSLDEAKEHRLRLMDVRTAFQNEAREKWRQNDYSFCEH
ncbi:hypothetical protein B0J13DRAFT_595977 [Dactylonectria estremocensis]|uniref:Uncharacterized protein n=1 Tax=Dactylonectria estremocensis TaxID=1079267 RepID=A0A9P9EVC1_9HYPO|nr:hypothetical protein B0J13DRAFT_595977 [Dactylonectria estremocensis]